jgi:hypothetical protein
MFSKNNTINTSDEYRFNIKNGGSIMGLTQSIGVLARKPLFWFFENTEKEPAPGIQNLDVPLIYKDRLDWLRKPLKRQAKFSIQKGHYEVRVYDQPGRWMTDDAMNMLYFQLLNIAWDAIDTLPRYGFFTQKREAFANRIFAVVHDKVSQQAVGFTAMVYLPFQQTEKITPIIHLGLTMIRRAYRGHRLQTPLFKKIFLLAMLNQRCLSFIMTNIAASPAGIGATSDYFVDVYPNYKGTVSKTFFHENVAQQILANYREEFGCSRLAVFDPENFVVRGSNQAEGGGAAEFIKDDPVSRYRVDACNEFCRNHLNFQSGDEMFQVGKVDFFQSSWASRKSKRKLKPSAHRQNNSFAQNVQMDAR